MKAIVLCVLSLCLSPFAQAQSLDEREQAIAFERAQLAQQREQLQQAYDRTAKDCWQRFAVNDCLAQARQLRRSRSEPLRQRELELNALYRAVREERRLLRLGEPPAQESGS